MNIKQGTLYLMASWIVFSISGFALNFWLGRTLGPEIYGLYGLIMSILSWIEIMVINSIPYSVSKFVAAENEKAYGILWTSLRIQAVLAVVLYGLVYVLAPLFEGLFQESGLTLLFRVAFLDVLFFGFYHLLLNFQNGLGLFKKQALLIAFHSLSKLGFVVLLVSWNHSLQSALWANVLASVLGIAAGLSVIRFRKAIAFSGKTLIRFALPSVAYFLLVSLLFSVDLWFVQYFLHDAGRGHYVAASTLSKIPYYIFLGLSATVLPAVSKYFAMQDDEKIKQIIQSAQRFFFVFALPVVVLISIYAKKFIILFYGIEYAMAGPILSVLIWAMTFFALLALLTTVLNALNRPHISMYIAFCTVILDVVLNMILVPHFQSAGAAWAAFLSIFAGVIISYIVLNRFIRHLMDFSMLRRVSAGGSLLLVSALLLEPINVFAASFIGFAFYIICLVVFREIKPIEISQLIHYMKSILKK